MKVVKSGKKGNLNVMPETECLTLSRLGKEVEANRSRLHGAYASDPFQECS